MRELVIQDEIFHNKKVNFKKQSMHYLLGKLKYFPSSSVYQHQIDKGECNQRLSSL
jgi:hypothetical protein